MSSLSSAAEQRRLFAMHFVLWSSVDSYEVEEVEEKGEVESRRTHHEDGHGWRYESAQDLSHECM